MHFLYLQLVIGLKFVDLLANASTVSGGKRHGLEALGQVELDIASLKIMVVDAHAAWESSGLRVNGPLALPFATPETRKVKVDARNVDLKLAIRVKTKTCSGGAVPVSAGDVMFDRILYLKPKDIFMKSYL